MPEGETPAFESPDYEENGIKRLFALSQAAGQSVFGIKRPSYFASAKVASRIRSHAPEAVLFAVLRNPVDRAVSAYFHNVKYGFIPPLPIEHGLRKILHDTHFTNRYRRALEIIKFGHYADHLEYYEFFLRTGRLNLLLHEDVVANPRSCIKNAYAYLGVKADFIPASLNDRPQSVTYSLPRLRFISLFNPLRFKYNPERTRLENRQTKARVMKVLRVADAIDRRILAPVFGNRRPTLSSELKSTLNRLYTNDAQAVRRTLGCDLPDWPSEPQSCDIFRGGSVPNEPENIK